MFRIGSVRPLLLAALLALRLAGAAGASDRARTKQSKDRSDIGVVRSSARLAPLSGTGSARAERTVVPTRRSAAGPRNLRVRGRIAYEPVGRSGFIGVDTMYIEVRDDDIGGHSVIWSGYTNSSGEFDTGVQDISDDDSEPDLYIYAETDSANVTVEDGDVLRENYSWVSDIVEDYTGFDYNFGTLVPEETGVGSELPAINAFDAIGRAHRMLQLTTTLDIPKVNVLWPSGDDFSYDYDGEIHLGANTYQTQRVLHQYAHHAEAAVGMAASASNGCAGDCQFCDKQTPSTEDFYCPTTPSVARSEGFAEWFTRAAHRDFETRYTNDDGEPHGIAGATELEWFPPEIYPNDPMNHVLDLSEARALCGADVQENANQVLITFAVFLEDLADDLADDHPWDGLNECTALGDFAVLRAYLLDNPTTPVDMIDQLIADNPSDLPELYSNAANISQVYASRFPPDTEPPGVVLSVDSSSHDPIGSPLPCIDLAWGSPLDDVTGACGYSVVWTTGEKGADPDFVEDIHGTCVEVTEGPFDVGENYISLRAIDCAGHWSEQTRTLGPFEVLDCNSNGLVDICDVNCFHGGYEGCFLGPDFCNFGACGLSEDCNDNLAPDECDIAAGESEDCNNNGVPDECEDMSHWGEVSGSWHDGSYWEEGVPPGENYHVCVRDREGDIGVFYEEGTHEIASLACDESFVLRSRSYVAPSAYLTINEGGYVGRDLRLDPIRNAVRLTLNDDLQVNGLLDLDGGEITGPGEVKTFGGMNVTDATKISVPLLDLLGPSTSSDRILISGGAIIHNDFGQTWEHTSDTDIIWQTSGKLVNDGVFRRTTGTGTATLGCRIENHGEFRVESGSVRWRGGSATDGDVVALPGTTFFLYCGGHDFLPDSSITAESIIFDGGNCGHTYIRGTYDVSDLTEKISSSGLTFTSEANIVNYAPNMRIGGLATFEPALGRTIEFDTFRGGSTTFINDDPITIGTMTLTDNGVMRTPATITIEDHLDWYPGTRFEGPGLTRVNGTMTLHSGNSVRSLTHRVMEIASAATFKSGLGISGDDSLLHVLPTGSIDFQVDGTLLNGTHVRNEGYMVKSGGSGVTQFQALFRNEGVLEVQTGTLRFYTYYSFDFEQTAGETRLSGGDLDIVGVRTLVFTGGQVVGDGTIAGPASCAGCTIAPSPLPAPQSVASLGEPADLPVGTLTMTGPLTLGENAVVELDVLSANPRTNDRVVVSGTATLAGELRIIADPGYVPQRGDVFTFLEHGTRNGQFDSLSAPPEFEIAYAANEVRVGWFQSADTDFDGDTDLLDFRDFQRCFAGSGNPPAPACPEGVDADLDNDGDVDLDDLALADLTQNTGPK